MRRNRIARNIGPSVPVFRGAPQLPRVNAPVPVPTPALLSTAQFVGTSNPIDPVTEGVIWSHTVPEGRMTRLGDRQPGRDQVYRARPITRETGSATSSAGGVLTITLAVVRLLASPDLGDVGSIRVAVRPNAGGDWVEQAAAALTVNYTTQVVTVSGLTASTLYDWRVYGLPAAGRFRIAVASAGAGLTSETTIAETGLVDLAEVRQFRGDQVPRLNDVAIALPKDRVLVYVESPYQIVHAETLTPGAILIGADLESIELRSQQVTAASVARYALAHAPGVTLDRIWRAFREIQAGRIPQDPELAGVPPIPGFRVN